MTGLHGRTWWPAIWLVSATLSLLGWAVATGHSFWCEFWLKRIAEEKEAAIRERHVFYSGMLHHVTLVAATTTLVLLCVVSISPDGVGSPALLAASAGILALYFGLSGAVYRSKLGSYLSLTALALSTISLYRVIDLPEGTEGTVLAALGLAMALISAVFWRTAEEVDVASRRGIFPSPWDRPPLPLTAAGLQLWLRPLAEFSLLFGGLGIAHSFWFHSERLWTGPATTPLLVTLGLTTLILFFCTRVYRVAGLYILAIVTGYFSLHVAVPALLGRSSFTSDLASLHVLLAASISIIGWGVASAYSAWCNRRLRRVPEQEEADDSAAPGLLRRSPAPCDADRGDPDGRRTDPTHRRGVSRRAERFSRSVSRRPAARRVLRIVGSDLPIESPVLPELARRLPGLLRIRRDVRRVQSEKLDGRSGTRGHRSDPGIDLVVVFEILAVVPDADSGLCDRTDSNRVAAATVALGEQGHRAVGRTARSSLDSPRFRRRRACRVRLGLCGARLDSQCFLCHGGGVAAWDRDELARASSRASWRDGGNRQSVGRGSQRGRGSRARAVLYVLAIGTIYFACHATAQTLFLETREMTEAILWHVLLAVGISLVGWTIVVGYSARCNALLARASHEEAGPILNRREFYAGLLQHVILAVATLDLLVLFSTAVTSEFPRSPARISCSRPVARRLLWFVRRGLRLEGGNLSGPDLTRSIHRESGRTRPLAWARGWAGGRGVPRAARLAHDRSRQFFVATGR